LSMTLDGKALAVEAYNKGQDLYYAQRTSDEDIELLSLAFTSRHFWKLAGGNQQFAIADWFVSRVFVALGEASLAVRFAEESLKYSQTNFPQWTIASLHEGAARAYKCAGDLEQMASHVKIAEVALDSESNSADAQVIREQLTEL